MECKFTVIIVIISVEDELIETLWNVNKAEKRNCKKKSKELIETLWNVNIQQEKRWRPQVL